MADKDTKSANSGDSSFTPLPESSGGDIHAGARLRQAHALEFIAMQFEALNRRMQRIEDILITRFGD